jgi:hypothetical protein
MYVLNLPLAQTFLNPDSTMRRILLDIVDMDGESVECGRAVAHFVDIFLFALDPTHQTLNLVTDLTLM